MWSPAGDETVRLDQIVKLLVNADAVVFRPGGNWQRHFVERRPLGRNTDRRKTGRVLTGSEWNRKTPPLPGDRHREQEVTSAGSDTRQQPARVFV